MIPFFIILGILVLFLAVLFLRAAMYRPIENPSVSGEEIRVDGEKALHDLAEMVRVRTVSSRVKNEEDEEEFTRFRALLPTLFPYVYGSCSVEYPSARSILIRWEGKAHTAPTVLMSHYDVVDVNEAEWEKPPFEGVYEDGVLWGRGTLDTKGTLNGILSAAEQLIKEGFVPKNDIYFAFGGNEEINGDGSKTIVSLFRERGITPGLVLDEGGAVVEKVFPGVTRPCALIGIAEKGFVNIEYSIRSGGGHSSSPKPHTPIGRLSLACARVEAHPMRFRLTAPARAMLDTLGRHSTFLYRLIFANLWCFAPVLNLLTRKIGGELNALVRTTVAFTQMEGSKGMNVIPPTARMVSNSRILEGDSVSGVRAYLEKTVNDPDITVRVIEGQEPSRISTLDCEGYRRLAEVTRESFPRAIVSPYLMLACSDSRHWGEISDKVYRFSAMALSAEERALIHGNNERIPKEIIEKTVAFYIRLMKKS